MFLSAKVSRSSKVFSKVRRRDDEAKAAWGSNKLLPQRHRWGSAFSFSLSRYSRASSSSSRARKFRFSVSSWSAARRRDFFSSPASGFSRSRCCHSPRPPCSVHNRIDLRQIFAAAFHSAARCGYERIFIWKLPTKKRSKIADVFATLR